MSEVGKPIDSLWGRCGYVPHARQRDFHDSSARYKVAVCGRRFGKSAAAAREAYKKIFQPNTRGWIVGPTYDLGEKEFRYMWNDLVITLGLGDSLIRKGYNVRAGDMYFETPWHSHVAVKSADRKDSLVGEGLDWVIMAEAAKMPKDIWEKYIRPALADHKGSATFVTTPEGYNWFYELYQFAQNEPDWETFKFPSWTNPYVYPLGEDDPEILQLRRSLPRVLFEQEVAAEFTAFAGHIYDEFDPALHVVHNYVYQPTIPNYLAFDFGFTNPFVALDIQVNSSGEMYIWREHYVAQETISTHISLLKWRENPFGYSVVCGFGDAADPGAIQTINDSGLCRVTADGKAKPWEEGVYEVKRLLNPENPRLFIAKECVNTINEFKNYRLKMSRNSDELPTVEKPLQVDDHAMDAIRYFVMHMFKLGGHVKLEEFYSSILPMYGSGNVSDQSAYAREF